MRVRVRLFASLREEMGDSVVRDVAAGTSVAALWEALVGEQPALADVPVRFAVREVYVDGSHTLAEGDELAVFPPVSGGG